MLYLAPLRGIRTVRMIPILNRRFSANKQAKSKSIWTRITKRVKRVLGPANLN